MALLQSWNPSSPRQFIPDTEWIADLASYIQKVVDLRINHVRVWLDLNIERFQGGPAAIDDFFFFFWINLYSGFTDSRSSPVAVHVLLQLGYRSYVKGAPPLVRIN